MRAKFLASFLLFIFILNSPLISCGQGSCYSSGTHDEKLIFSTELESSIPQNERILPASIYYDKAFGNWIGQMIGNIYGLPTEGHFIQTPNPEYVAYYTDMPEGAFTDDDTSMEWVFLHMLEEHGLEIMYSQVTEEWIDHINQMIWVANARARELMNEGYMPPETGSKEHNENWGAIDAQIECELFGVINPGMGGKAYEMAKWFARVTNDDYAVEAAAFYATMFSYAFFESDVSALVEMSMTKIPNSSLTWEVVSDVVEWHKEYSDWRETRKQIWEKYGEYGWVSSPLNLASVVMAVLYGNGDFDHSLIIANAAGWDNDCNSATTAGLLGTIVGESGIHQRWKEPLMDLYRNTNRDNLPSDTISNIASRTQFVAEKVMLACGSMIFENGTEKVYIIPTDLPWTEQPSNSFSDENLASRSSSAPICYDRPFTPDFSLKLGILNDGVIRDQSVYTLKSQNVEAEDWWGFTFGETLNFDRLVYYPGDIPSQGSEWETLTVQYRDKMGRWLNVMGLEITPLYDLLAEEGRIPQRIVLIFGTVNGTGVRILGKPKGPHWSTSVAELEVFYGDNYGETSPTRPTDLKATRLEGQRVFLEWTDTSSNEYVYEVRRREFWQTSYEGIAVLGTSAERYIDSATQPLRLYYYIVVAINSAGSSDASNETSVFTLTTTFWDVQIYVLIGVMIVAAVVILTLMKKGKFKIRIVSQKTI